MKKNVTVYTVEEVEKLFGCKLETKHGILPMTELPNSNLVAESVLLLSKSFSYIHVMSSAVIVSTKEELAENEKNLIDYLIKESDNSPFCDDDDEGYEILAFFPNYCISIVSPDQCDSNHEYMGLKSDSGYCFDLIEANGIWGEIYDSDPDMFLAKVIETDVIENR